MRTRKEIEDEVRYGSGYDYAERSSIAATEVLLDIRELLSQGKGEEKCHWCEAKNKPSGFAVASHCPIHDGTPI